MTIAEFLELIKDVDKNAEILASGADVSLVLLTAGKQNVTIDSDWRSEREIEDLERLGYTVLANFCEYDDEDDEDDDEDDED